MEKMVDTYTSTGAKYLLHEDRLQTIIDGNPRPISLQIAPTNRCNLRCVFCSVEDRDRNLEFDFEELKTAISIFKDLGIKTVEISGGGEPTMYPKLNELVLWCKKQDLEIAMITNGLKLQEIPKEVLEAFTWIRVSMVGLDYYEEDKIKFPNPWPKNVSLGMSYVLGQLPYLDNDWLKKHKNLKVEDTIILLKRLKDIALKVGAEMVRCVPECFAEESDMIKLHDMWAPIITEIGHPLFFQFKRQKQAEYCWIDCLKPWLHCDGLVYPCNSVSLHNPKYRDFNRIYSISHWRNIETYYLCRGNESIPWVKKLCKRCTFTENNDMLFNYMNGLRKSFDIVTKHKNFV